MSGRRDASVQVGQVGVDQGRGHGTVTDGGGDSLDRAVARVAGDEESGVARLEEERIARERPPRSVRTRREEVPTGDEVAASRRGDSQPSTPAVSGSRADQDEHGVRREASARPRRRLDRHALQALISVAGQRARFVSEPRSGRAARSGRRGSATSPAPASRLRTNIVTWERVVGEVQRRLARRIGATDDRNADGPYT